MTNNLNEPASVFRNNAAGSHYVKIKFSGEGGNTFGIGARVKVFIKNKAQYIENQPVRGFQSSVEPGVVTVGLGNNEKADSLQIVWPDGAVEVQYGVAANRTLVLERKNATLQSAARSKSAGDLRPADFETQIPFDQPAGDLQDIAREKLMPWSLGTQGPEIEVRDLNGDGLDDFYTLDTAFIQQTDGTFLPRPTPLFFKNYLSKNTSCVRLADFDGDGSEDMFIGTRWVTGAYGLSAKSYLLKNNGAGQFIETGVRSGKGEAGIGGMITDACWADVDNDKRPELIVCGEWMPLIIYRNTVDGFEKTEIPHSTGLWNCIGAADFDGDGDMFIGTRWVTGAYGLSAKSYILKNNGANQFTETSIRAGKGEAGIGGMITDARWADLDNDKRPDLIVCGEWMPITIYRNTVDGFEKTEIPHSAGLWNCIEATDFDGDGDMDLMAGNLGLNSNLRASEAEPLGLWVKDFDGNGSMEPVLTYYRQGKNCVFADKDAIVNQLPFLKKKFLEYREYAESTFEEVFPEDIRKGALHREAEILSSCYFENEGNGRWKVHPLPNEAQFGPAFAILPYDFNGDGHMDALLGGNFYEVQPAIGRFDASYGTLLLGDGKGNFRPVEPSESGIWLPGPVRGLEVVNGPGGRKRLLVAANGYPFRLIDLEKISPVQ